MERETSLRSGAMQDWPLTLDRFIDHAARWHGDTPIISRHNDGTISRTDWRGVRAEALRVSAALLAAGIRQGDRVATMAMNSATHLAAWYGIMGIGAVCHTLNPRLSPEQLCYIIADAGDRMILADGIFAPLVEKLLPRCPAVDTLIVMDDERWEAFLASGEGQKPRWGDFPETSPAGLCYTSGTTGNPKGVLYTHRSNYLHCMTSLQPDVMGIAASEVVLPVVPMFHANAWGVTFSGAAVGCKLVMPGLKLDGRSLYELMETERVTFSAGVPTVWQGLLQFLDTEKLRLSTVRRVLIGGAACPDSLFRAFEAHGIEPVHAWGMTETSPLGSVGMPVSGLEELDEDERFATRLKQGRVPMGIDLRIVDAEGVELPRDGATSGYLQVRGHSVVESYYGQGQTALTADGWFDTGDVATIDALGYMRITDRAKDAVKSGGEWISSVDLENTAMAHPAIALAAVIGMPHPKWDERPILIVQLREGADASGEELRAFMADRRAKWEVPDAVLFIDAIPLGATGKIDKRRLRELYLPGWSWEERVLR